MENQKLPNSTAIIVLSIASILLCWCYGVLGLILAVVALILALKSTKVYHAEPEIYSDYGTIKTGKILAIFGLILNLLFLGFIIWIISLVGLDAFEDEELIRERMEDYFGQ